MIQNIIFDLDGTIVDSSRDVLYCLRKAYNTIPIYYGIQIKKHHIGLPLNDIISQITPDISESHKSIVVKEFRNLYDTSTFPRSTLYPGALELLQRLKLRGSKIFISTNRASFSTTRILTKFNINFFDGITTSTHYKSKTDMIGYLVLTHDLDQSNTIMIGDDAQDIIAAHDNSIKSIAVLNGYGNTKKLLAAKPFYTIKDISTLNKPNGINI